METEGAVEQTNGAAVVDEAEHVDLKSTVARKVVGWIIAAVLIFLAQRDLRRRTPELVRGPVGLWKAVAMMPPGAVAYLLLGRRRAAPQATVEMLNSIAA